MMVHRPGKRSKTAPVALRATVAAPYPPQNDEVMAVFAAAAERNDPRMANLYIDVSANVTDEITPADAALVAQHVR
jgi:hypothetical protein